MYFFFPLFFQPFFRKKCRPKMRQAKQWKEISAWLWWRPPFYFVYCCCAMSRGSGLSSYPLGAFFLCFLVPPISCVHLTPLKTFYLRSRWHGQHEDAEVVLELYEDRGYSRPTYSPEKPSPIQHVTHAHALAHAETLKRAHQHNAFKTPAK